MTPTPGQASLRLICNCCGFEWHGSAAIEDADDLTADGLAGLFQRIRETSRRRGWTSRPSPETTLSVAQFPYDGSPPTLDVSRFPAAALDFCPECSRDRE